MYAHELFEQNKPRVVVTYPGRFHPFHQGHAGVFSQLQKKFGAENVFIATSNDQSSAKSPFNFSDKYQLMTAAGVPADKIIQTNAMYALPEGIDPYNTIFITAVGAPDADRLNPDSVLKRDKKDKSGNIIKAAGSPGYYKKWDPSRDPVSADQHGYVIVIPEIKKSIKINGQTYDVSHGTETRNLWNAVRDDEKSRLEFLSQLYSRPSSELANIFDKIPQTASEDIAPGSSDSTSPIHGGQIYEQVVAEQAVTETAEELQELTQFSKVMADFLTKSYAQYIKNPQTAEYVQQQISQPITDGAPYRVLMPTIGIGSVPDAGTYTSPGLELAKKFVSMVVAYFPAPGDSNYYGFSEAAPAVYDTQSRTVIINKDFLSNPAELAGTIAHEVQHGIDDLKSRKGLSVKTDQLDLELSHGNQGKAFKYKQSAGATDNVQKYQSYLAMPHEVNARFTEVINDIKQRIEKEDIQNIGSAGLSDLARSAFKQHYMHEVFPNGAKDPGYKRLLSRVYAWLSKYYNDRIDRYGSFKPQPATPVLEEQGVAEGSLNEFAPGAGDNGGGEDPYKYPKPEHYARSADYFGKFEADHFDREKFDDATGVFKGYWGRTQIAYFKFDNPARTGGDDPGMGWYYEPESVGNSDATIAKPAVNNAEQRKQQELGMIDAFLKSGNRPGPGSQIYQLMKKHGLAESRLDEGWSQKYKSSINCSHPKGFSQKAHCAGKRKHNESVETEMVCEDCGMCETHGDHSQDNLAEACWKGYHKEGMKTMFGKRYPNCVKNKNESLETYIRKGECPGCGDRMVAESQLNEKQDACYHKVKSRYKVWPSAYASGALVQCRKKGAANWGNKNESITQEEYDQLDENLKKWFSDKWVRFGPDGKIRGPCARGSSSEGKPKCLPQSKAHALGKKGRASAGARKRKQDPDANRSGRAINVATKTKSNEGASGVIATKKQAQDPRYSMSLTKDVRPGQIEKNLRAFKLAEQANNNNEMFELFAKFLPLAMRDLGLTDLPKIVPELRIESTDGQATFGRFVDGEMIIQLALANRHPVDILRTLAHELVHYKQKTLGKIKHDSGETGSPEENQANTIAGIIMRHFNKEYPDAVNMQPIELNESQVTVNYGIGKNPGKLVKVGADGRLPHAKLHVNVNKKTAKKLGIPHFNENFADGRNPGDKGSLKAKVKGKVTIPKARAILKNKNSTPRAKQLAHWFINMNKGRNK